VAAALTIGGLGVGVAMPPAVDAMLGTLARTWTGSRMGLAGTLASSGALGVAILGSMLNSSYRSGLSGHLARLPARVQGVAEGSVAAAAAVAQDLPAPWPSLCVARLRRLPSGMADVMLVCGGVAVVAALS
jgi:hypothetical protein